MHSGISTVVAGASLESTGELLSHLRAGSPAALCGLHHRPLWIVKSISVLSARSYDHIVVYFVGYLSLTLCLYHAV